MRILQVCAVDFTALHLLHPLLRACQEDGWEVEFACAEGPGVATLRQEGFRYRPVPMTRRLSPLAQLRAVLALARSLRRDRPDVVHTHTPVGGVVGRAAAAVAGGSWIVHTFHGLPFHGDRFSPTERAFLAVERVLASRTALFFSQASGDAERAARLGIARREQTIVIGNGVDVRRFAPDEQLRLRVRSELGVPGEAVLVVTVGRLVREKGLLDLADAAHLLRDEERLRFLVVGAALPSDRSDASRALDVHPAAKALGPRWQRLGYRPDVDRLLKGADLFVLPSYREGLPRSVIEAMATGLPTIATNIPACRELVELDVTGLLVSAGDAEALAKAIARLAQDAALRGGMGRRARERALAWHDERDVLRRQTEALRRLIEAQGSSVPQSGD